MTASGITSCRRALTAALLAAGLASTALGQPAQVQTPGDLNWKWMNEVVFDAPKLPSSGSAAQRELVSAIWANDLRRTVVSGTGQRAASFILVGEAGEGRAQFVFSMFSRVGSGCEDPPNGNSGANHMYAKCPLRVTMITSDGRGRSQDFPGYCYLNLDSTDHARTNYHTEFAFDRRSTTAYFRVIQHGRTVPECSRSIRISSGP